MSVMFYLSLFFFNDTATTEIYTLSLHDALPILPANWTLACGTALPPAELAELEFAWRAVRAVRSNAILLARNRATVGVGRSEEHTSELQSRQYLVCRLLLEKKKKQTSTSHLHYP